MATDTTIIEFLLEAKDSTSEAFESFHSRLDGIGEHLTRIGEIAAGFLGAELFMEATGGVERFGSALISTNMEAEKFQNTLQGMYVSSTQAKDAFAWLTQNEMHVPFDIQSIQEAATTVIGFGGNIRQVIPGLETMASIMPNLTLPNAAIALMDAHANIWRMMDRDLHITKEELASTGLVAIDTAGHVTGDLDAAFAAYVAKRYPDALKLQMDTLGGAVSSLHSQFTYLERELGQGVFSVVKQDVQDLTAYMQDNKAEIANYAAVVGSALGRVAVDVFEVAKAIGVTLFEAVVVLGNLWQQISGPVSTAFALVGSIVTAFVNWFTATALPMIETALGVVATWWDSHQARVSTTLTNIMNDVKLAFGYIAEQAGNVMEVVGGAFDVGWGYVEIILGGALALMSGNFDQFGKDLDEGTNRIMTGVIEGFAGILKYVATWAVDLISIGSTALLPLGNALMEPWTKMAQGIRDIWKDVGGFIAGAVGAIVTTLDNMINKAIDGINTLIDGYNASVGKLPWLGDKIKSGDISKIDTTAGVAGMTSAITDFFNKSAPGIDSNQRIQAGVSQDQARADIQAQAKAILDPILADISAHGASILAEYGLTTTSGPGSGISQARGKSFIDDLEAMIRKLLLSSGPGIAPGLPGGGGNVNGNLNVHGGLTGPELPGGDGGFFSGAWGALGPHVGVDTGAGTAGAGGGFFSGAWGSQGPRTSDAATAQGPAGFFRAAWDALGPTIADTAVAAATAGATGLKSPTFVGGYDDPGLSAGRGNAAFRLGFVGANDSQKTIAMLEAQVSYLQQQLAEERAMNLGIQEIARNTNPNHPANAAARTGLFAGAWGANRAGGF